MGSASTGLNYIYKGGGFSATSDIDFFIVDDILFQKAVSLGAKANSKGLIAVRETRYIPELIAVEKELAQELGRKTSIRIFSKKGYDAIKSTYDVIAP